MGGLPGDRTDVGALEALLARIGSCALDELTGVVDVVHPHYQAPMLPDETIPIMVERQVSFHRRVTRALGPPAVRLIPAGRDDAAIRLPEILLDFSSFYVNTVVNQFGHAVNDQKRPGQR